MGVKLKKGTIVKITEGTEKGTFGIIESVSMKPNKFSVGTENAKYKVVTESKPTGIVLPEAYLDSEILENDLSAFNEASANNHIFDTSFVEYSCGDMKIVVYTNENANVLPHFHVYTESETKELLPSKKTFGSCLLFTEASYFMHDKYTNVINGENMKKITEWLTEKAEDSMYTNWQQLKNSWNVHNHNNQIDLCLNRPDYKSIMPIISSKKEGK